MLFNFNDKKSREQVAAAIQYQNDTKQINSIKLAEYNQKLARLSEGSRFIESEWELLQ